MVDGSINGRVTVKDILQQPNFTSDVTVNNLSFKKDTIGDINVKVNNNTHDVFATNVSITGKGNNIAFVAITI